MLSAPHILQPAPHGHKGQYIVRDGNRNKPAFHSSRTYAKDKSSVANQAYRMQHKYSDRDQSTRHHHPPPQT